MKPLDFAKKYLIIKYDPEPGRSKNLNKTKLKEEIDNAAKEFMENQNQYIQKFNQLLSQLLYKFFFIDFQVEITYGVLICSCIFFSDMFKFYKTHNSLTLLGTG